MLCTSLCASAGMLMRFMSPSTRIIGGTPADKCRSDALFLTANAKSCAMSTAMNAPSGQKSRLLPAGGKRRRRLPAIGLERRILEAGEPQEARETCIRAQQEYNGGVPYPI